MGATASASAAWVDLNDYCRKHSRATLLLLTAAHDYASARCLLLNGLFGGLVFGAQTIEKLLKAYILFADPSREVKKAFSHSLTKLLQEAASLYPQPEFLEIRAIGSEIFWPLCHTLSRRSGSFQINDHG